MLSFKMELLNGFKTLVNTLFFYFVLLEFSLSYTENVRTENDIILSRDISYLNFDFM